MADNTLFVKYITNPKLLYQENIATLIGDAETILHSLTQGSTLRLKQDAYDSAVTSIDKNINPGSSSGFKGGICLVSIGDQGGTKSSVTEIKKKVKTYIRHFQKVVFVFYLRAADQYEEGEGLSSMQVEDFLNDYRLSTYFYLKYIKEGIHRSTSTIEIFESFYNMIHGVTLTAMSEKASLQPLWITSYIMTANTAQAVQQILETLETTVEILRLVDVEKIISAIVSSVTKNDNLRRICSDVQIDLVGGSTVRLSYPQCKKMFLRKVRMALAEQIVEQFAENLNIEINKLVLEINPDSSKEFIENLNRILEVVEVRLMASYDIWQRCFGVDLSSREWRLEMAGKVQQELSFQEEHLKEEVSFLYNRAISKTRENVSEKCTSLRHARNELERTAKEMDVSDFTEQGFNQYTTCRTILKSTRLPSDVAVTCGNKDQDDKTPWMSIRSEKYISLSQSGVKIDSMSYEESAQEMNTVFTESYKNPVDNADIVKTINTHGPTLMQKHSNLTAISASSVHLNKENKPEICDPPCIVFFAATKGIIPFGEKLFPRKLGDYEVCVIEGHCRLGPLTENQRKRRPLRMGCSIGVLGSQSSGSIGPLVRIRGTDMYGFLTCQHVVNDFNPMAASSDRRVVQPSDQDNALSNLKLGHDDRLCGQIEPQSMKFENIHLNDEEFFVDAALVYITEGNPERPELRDGKEMRIRTATTDLSTHSDLTLYKDGRTTGFTSGFYNSNGLLGKVDQRDGYLLMKNLCQIASNPGELFFDCGDSGCMIWKYDRVPGGQRVSTFFGMGIGLFLGSRISFAVPHTAIEQALPNVEILRFNMPFYQDVEMQEDRREELMQH